MRLMAVIDTDNAPKKNMLVAALAGHSIVYPRSSSSGLVNSYTMEAKKLGASAVVVAHVGLLHNLIARMGHSPARATLNDYRGSTFLVGDMKFLILDSLKNIYAYPYGKFLTKLWVNKLTQEVKTPTETPFNYVDFDGNEERLLELAEKSVIIGVDIETVKWNVDIAWWKSRCANNNVNDVGTWTVSDAANQKKAKHFVPLIDMVGYTFIYPDSSGRLVSASTTIRFDDIGVGWVRKFNNTKPPKAMQNGSYDSTYFVRFGCPLHNYLFDTFVMMHAWYSELPRDLGFIGSLFMKHHMYWKDEIDESRMEYCAKDTYTTAWAFLFMQRQAPTWARNNYKLKFKHIFLNLCCGLEGYRVDEVERDRLALHYRDMYDQELNELKEMVHPQFNPNSPQQVTKLLQAMVDFKVDGSDKISMRRCSAANPILSIIISKIAAVREASKKLSTYINADLFCGRLLYELNSSGTDTGRDASKASNLWVGTQAQNLDNKMRTMYVADPGYVLCASDGSQAESRTTGYIAQDLALIDSVENSPDFHSKNCSLFFGIPFEELWDTEKSKTLNKAMRDLAKRVNHGANYNMTEVMLLITMGVTNVRKAKELLGLPPRWSLVKTCAYLLDAFDKTYPKVRGSFQDEIIEEVNATHMLKIPCEELPWVRYTFKSPGRDKASKSDLNELVATKPQGLSALIIREGAFEFWMEWQIKRNVVRLKNLVHDEVQYQIPEDSPYIEEAGHSLSMSMSKEYTVHGRKLVIPCGDPLIGKRLSDVKG